ncbi:hypothetical protein QE152_g37006 [Popillia japonica]|uniref:Uncharacterized protein n=1 Tax=Popillia japonica TaxID=7064 RepID=A0AAW1IBW3_POPJA
MKWCPFEFIGRTFGEDREIPSFTDPTDFESGLIVDSGICYMRFFRKLFIPCYLRSENIGRAGVCSPIGVSDASQRCKQKRKKRTRRRRRCQPVKLVPEKKCSTPKVIAPTEQQTPPLEQAEEVKPPKPESAEERCAPTPQRVLCPNCNAPSTIIVCDSCNRCHKIVCNTNK